MTIQSTSTLPRCGVIRMDSRGLYQMANRAMQGDVIIAIIELITNSDDSYDRVGQEKRKIVITYKKSRGHRYRTEFTVRDEAAGQNREDFHKNFTKYYKAGDLDDDNKRRGYFGKGAKDALACMEDGTITSFKDGRFIQCSIFFKDKEMRYEVLKDCRITSTLRDKYGIEKNGTIASFWASSKEGKKITVPLFNRLYNDLSNHYMLRKLLQDKDLTVSLINLAKQRTNKRLTYIKPKGIEVVNEQFMVEYDGFAPFVIDISVHRSDFPLSQKEKGSIRQGGLLIMDGKNVVLDISLFKYDYSDFASKLFGEVVIHGFRKLLKENEPVLSSERNGLIRKHGFVESLVAQIEMILSKQVQIEKNRSQRHDYSDEGKAFQKRYKDFNVLLNEIADQILNRDEEQQEETKDMIYPINGFDFDQVPPNVKVDKHKVYNLRIDTDEVPPGTVVSIRSTNPTIKIVNADSKLVVPKPRKKGLKIVRKKITVKGTVPHESGKIVVAVSDRDAKASIYITPPEELMEYGIAFAHGTAKTPPGKVKKIILLGSSKVIKSGDIIILESDNPNIHISQEKIVVNEVTDSDRGLLKYELEVWGQGLGETGTIIATCDGTYLADCECIIGVSIEEKSESKSKSNVSVFNPPDMNLNPHPPQAASYDIDTEKVIIYAKFPTVRHYVGEDLEYKNSLPAQQRIAHLILEKYFYRLASKDVKRQGTSLNIHSEHDYIQGEANKYMEIHGAGALKVLVDQELLKKSIREKGIS